MMNSYGMGKSSSERLMRFPNVDSLLKISLGLVLFTMISSVLVYAETMPVDIDGTSFDVEYTATGMTISNIEADLDSISLIITVDVTDSSGILNITFDRSFFDSLFEGADDDFIILADADEPTFTETETTAQSRTLSIELPPGTEDVEIIGTVFGTSDDSAAEDAAGKAAEDAAGKAAEDAAAKAAEDTAAAAKAAEDAAAAAKAAEDAAAAAKAAEDAARESAKNTCGPGTILKDGECVLDERCGPGTILKDGECVIDSSSQSSSQPTNTSVKGMGKDLIIGVIAAFGVAGVVGIILAIMSKASKSRD